MAIKRRIRPLHHLVMLGIETIAGTVAWNNRASIMARFRKPADEPLVEPPRVVVDIANQTVSVDPNRVEVEIV